jgi:ATP phosphoribosyltransferase
MRLSLPSKGRLAEESLTFLAACGLSVYKPNPRQYEAVIPALPGLTVLFQRPGDIVASVRDGSVDFGITGMDVTAERGGENRALLVLHEALGFGICALTLAVPEEWENVQSVQDLITQSGCLGRPLRVATKYPNLTGRFLMERGIPHTLISAEGTLEAAPAIGYADLIADLVSSGQTLRDNRLRPLPDGVIQPSQATLIANTHSLQSNPEALEAARFLLETIEAHLRAIENLAIFANMRGESAEAIAAHIFSQRTIGGLQGPTISRMIARNNDPNWYDVHIVVRRSQLFQAVNELRAIGGSGVVVAPIAYIFEEEPPRYQAMLAALADKEHPADIEHPADREHPVDIDPQKGGSHAIS